ncbi:ferredoxin [uncultured Algibacter sp.]|uniref:ferredoxin n=1 Tax=uncultured Algibacter sp. TaxID=298659 RepID=UPI002603F1D2|nr:ferredoxin [uncultured Algibacter sp.]
MDFLKKIFSIKTKENSLARKERYPENSKGDFYVENQACITCGAPESVAPDLIEHSKLEHGHCYFKRQPTTADELDRAISAMQVSCIAGVRYGGKDQEILKRLSDLNLQAECDYTLTEVLKEYNESDKQK